MPDKQGQQDQVVIHRNDRTDRRHPVCAGGRTMADQSAYFATVVDARTFENNVSASTVYNSRDNVTVLWLDGLDYLPADSVVQ